MPKNEFRSLKTILNKVLITCGLEHTMLEIQVFQNWTDIVGKSLAKQCKPVSIEENTLYVEIKNNIWRSELAKRQQELVNLLDKKINHNHIKKIKLI